MRHRFSSAVVAFGLLLTAVPLLAHHAVQAQFDYDKGLNLTGKLTKVMWINPHGYIFMDVKGKDGKVKNWALEMVGPAALKKAGLSREDKGGFKVGETYTVTGFAAKDGTETGFIKDIKFPDGRVVRIWFGDPFAQ